MVERRRGRQSKPLEYSSGDELFLGSFIRQSREECLQQSLRQSAPLFGINRNSLSQIETNGRIPTKEQLNRIATVLGISLEEIQKYPLPSRLLWHTDNSPTLRKSNVVEVVTISKEELANMISCTLRPLVESMGRMQAEIERLSKLIGEENP